MSGHLTEAEIEAYLQSGREQSGSEVRAHLASCTECARLVRFDQRMGEAFVLPVEISQAELESDDRFQRIVAQIEGIAQEPAPESATADHPTDAALAEYAQGVLDEDLELVDSHVRSCAQCRAFVVFERGMRAAFASAGPLSEEELAIDSKFAGLLSSLTSRDLQSERGGNLEAPRHSRPFFRYGLPMAGLLAAGIAAMVLSRRPSQNAEMTSAPTVAASPIAPRSPSRAPASLPAPTPEPTPRTAPKAVPRPGTVTYADLPRLMERYRGLVGMGPELFFWLRRQEIALRDSLDMTKRAEAALDSTIRRPRVEESLERLADISARLDSLKRLRQRRSDSLEKFLGRYSVDERVAVVGIRGEIRIASGASAFSSLLDSAVGSKTQRDSANTIRASVPTPSRPAPAPGPTDQERAAAARREAIRELLEPIEFDSASNTIRGDGRQLLDAKLEVLNRYQAIRIRIAGYADEGRGDEGNILLGRRRAEAVRRYFEDRGVSPERLDTQTFGRERPMPVKSRDGTTRILRGVTVEIIAGGDSPPV